MHKLKLWLLTAAALALAACGGGGDETLVGGTTGPGGTTADVGSLTLLTSSPQLPSDGTADATITALVRDVNNNVMADIPVVFTANSGSLVVTQPSRTDDAGIVTARLTTAGDPTNRTITVSGRADDSNSTVTVNVVGTAVSITGPSSLPLNGSPETFNVVLTNAGGNGIGNRPVTVSSALGNQLSAPTVVTDSQGRASFTVTAIVGGNDTITVAALGISATQTVSVSAVTFNFTQPAALTEIPLGTNAVITVNYSQSGAPVANQPITFSTTRGTLTVGQVNTDGAGNASTTISSTNAGPALLTATNTATGTTIQRNVEFVATTPATLDLQANPFTVATNEQSTITAVVRDANGNLVKNQLVSFVLTDVTFGSLSVAQAITNSQGRAQTFYNASNTTSAVDGVRIDATVLGTAVTDFVRLTVAQREVFISLGTGNEIEELNTATYSQEWAIIITDAQGNGVDLVPVTVSVLSLRYWDGVRQYLDPPGVWATRPGTEALPAIGCPDEDINANPIYNRNGVLDPGEDANGNGTIEAGNKATVAAQSGGATVTTDANGMALVDVIYPQDYAYWLEVVIEARTSVQGTEYAEQRPFILGGVTTDFANENVSPPGIDSPFGIDGACNTPQ